jgi:hypothetical protein
MSEKEYDIITPVGVPIMGGKTLCCHKERGLTRDSTLWCPGCCCEWELLPEEGGWRITPLTRWWLERRVFARRRPWWHSFINPILDGTTYTVYTELPERLHPRRR